MKDPVRPWRSFGPAASRASCSGGNTLTQHVGALSFSRIIPQPERVVFQNHSPPGFQNHSPPLEGCFSGSFPTP